MILLLRRRYRRIGETIATSPAALATPPGEAAARAATPPAGVDQQQSTTGVAAHPNEIVIALACAMWEAVDHNTFGPIGRTKWDGAAEALLNKFHIHPR